MAEKRLTPAERRALLFTLASNRRRLEEQRKVLRRRLKDTIEQLEKIDQQLSDIEQSEAYLRD